MSTRATTRLLSCLLAIVLLITGCASQQPTPAAPAPIPVKLVVFGFISHAPFHIALAEGYFAEQGLDVETVPFQFTDDAFPALAAGEVDVMAGLPMAGLMNAIAGGVNLKIVADKGHISESSCDGYAVMARSSLVNDGTLTDVASLRGKTIQAQRTGYLAFLTEKLLRMGNLTLDDVEVVEMIPPMWPEAMERGTMDVHVGTTEPWITRILRSGYGQLWNSFRDWIPGYQFSSLMFGPTMLGENREAGKRFMVAFLKAVRQYNEGKTERNLDILTDALGLEREEIEQTCWVSMRGDGKVNVESILEFQDWAVEKGLVDTPVTMDQLFDPSFIEYANQVLGPAE
jgi:NitT/TauT family transport system substrate-binding protein